MTRQGPSFGGVLLASLTAGPIFLTWIGISMLITDPVSYPVRPEMIGPLILFMFPASVFGTILSLLPNLIGTVALYAMGKRNDGFRLSVVWALIGAAAAGVPAFLLAGTDNGAATCIFPLTLTGASCALICRLWARWPDDQSAGRSRNVSTTPQAISACPAK